MGLVLLFVLQGSLRDQGRATGSRCLLCLFVSFDWILSVVGIHNLITTFSGSSSCAFLVCRTMRAGTGISERQKGRRRELTYI